MQLIKFFIPSLIVLLFLNCCGLSKSPEKTATEFMRYLSQKNYEAAKRISTQRTANILDVLNTTQALKGKEETKNHSDFDCNCEQQDQKADCNCCQIQNPDQCLDFDVFLVEGEWLVELRKENGLR